MIDIINLVKQFPGTARPAVDRLTLTISDGEVCVLIGPSGCGKTTTMRIVNRMIEPDAGIVMLALLSGIAMTGALTLGDVGQTLGKLATFLTATVVGGLIAVPRLLGWELAKTHARVDELLGLVGMDPAVYRNRFPRELSGGQKQRVGVARALAADPPVMLMDEPFGAIDPITRTRLQDEF
jgi:osmoprotectant transport system ATP-binding protein